MCYSHLQPLDPSENPDLWCDPQYNPDLGEMAPPAPNADGLIGKDYFIKLDGDNETIWCYQSISSSNKASDFNG